MASPPTCLYMCMAILISIGGSSKREMPCPLPASGTSTSYTYPGPQLPSHSPHVNLPINFGTATRPLFTLPTSGSYNPPKRRKKRKSRPSTGENIHGPESLSPPALTISTIVNVDEEFAKLRDSAPPMAATFTSNCDHVPETPTPPSISLFKIIISKIIKKLVILENLPLSTLLAFQLLAPTVTDNGTSDSVTRPMTLIFLILLAVYCVVGSITDSVRGRDGQVYYGIATFSKIFLFDCPDDIKSGLNLSHYKLTSKDAIHAGWSLLMFAAVAFHHQDVTSCLSYWVPQLKTRQVFEFLPLVTAIAYFFIYKSWPNSRRGIRYLTF